MGLGHQRRTNFRRESSKSVEKAIRVRYHPGVAKCHQRNSPKTIGFPKGIRVSPTAVVYVPYESWGPSPPGLPPLASDRDAGLPAVPSFKPDLDAGRYAGSETSTSCVYGANPDVVPPQGDYVLKGYVPRNGKPPFAFRGRLTLISRSTEYEIFDLRAHKLPRPEASFDHPFDRSGICPTAGFPLAPVVNNKTTPKTNTMQMLKRFNIFPPSLSRALYVLC